MVDQELLWRGMHMRTVACLVPASLDIDPTSMLQNGVDRGHYRELALAAPLSPGGACSGPLCPGRYPGVVQDADLVVINGPSGLSCQHLVRVIQYGPLHQYLMAARGLAIFEIWYRPLCAWLGFRPGLRTNYRGLRFSQPGDDLGHPSP